MRVRHVAGWARAHRRGLGVLATLALVGGIGATLLALRVQQAVGSVSVPAFADVVAAHRGSEALLLDRTGIPLQRLRQDANLRQLDWIPLTQVSPALVRALIAAEDRRFRNHTGVDPLALASSLGDDLRGRHRGASTISMQVAALVLEDARPSGGPDHPRRDATEKLRQMRDALALERAWGKDQILEAYVNLLHFRNELVGVDAAARGLLAMGPSGLDDVQSAVLAALIRAPSAGRARVARRACAVLRAQDEAQRCGAAHALAMGLPAQPLSLVDGSLNEASHLAHRLLDAPGQRIRSTLDADLQRFATRSLRERVAELHGRNVEDGAVVVLDNASGDVLAYVGSVGSTSRAGDVDGVQALRQPGSALKPFLYAEAIDRRLLTAASLLEDTPLAVDTGSGLYAPQDYEREYRGPVTVRTSLGSSLNVPAIRALEIVGVPDFLERLRQLGMTSLDLDARHYGLGLALGDGEVRLLDLANAYRAIANGGTWSPVRLRADDAARAGSRRVFRPESAFVISDILADPAARAPTFGMASALETHGWAAVKTGTSKGMRDNWTVGFTDRYTVGVWVGNSSGAPMWDVSGVSGAAPVWQAIIDRLGTGAGSAPPRQPPPGLRLRPVRFQGGFEAARDEWFLQGSELALVEASVGRDHPSIAEPADGIFIAPDPDIPPARQRVRVRTNPGADPSLCLRLDDQPLAPCGELDVMSPLPPPGRHSITLANADGTVLAQARMVVRPAPTPGSRAGGGTPGTWVTGP